MKQDTGDPVISVTVWRGPRSALAALLNIQPAHLAALLKRRGLKRSGCIEVPVQSPTAMRTLAHTLRVADEEP